MGAITTGFVLAAGGDGVDAVAERFTAWARRWPAKELARRFDVSVKTAESWHAGRGLPQGRHMTAMVAEWGEAFLAYVYAPVLEDQALDRRLEAVEAVIADLRKECARHDHAAPTRPADAPAAHRVGGVARGGGTLVATARALIVGVLLGATALHLVPRLPATVAELVAEARDDWARLPRGGEDAKRAAPRLAVRLGSGRRMV